MTVIIKELIVQGKINKSSKKTDEDIIEIIESKVSKMDSGNALTESEKRQLIEECVATVLKELETKLGY
ncbi:MAG: hypothetical protein ACJAYY_001532 [Paraglaciecola sp.]|jgi:hypothetical protein|uniref:hypothetical protein n=1 Tax=Polaribacter sp. TaxID=1920175 RepID=UPI003AE65E1D|tara:strand:+ start:969 stop:1175 length:207 start_codon:yes stop_codon:yes gene_type:complete